LKNLILDLRVSGRILRRNRWQTAAIVLTLALAIGALTSVVTVVNAVLIEPYGPVQTDRWVYLWEHPFHSNHVTQINVVLWLPWSYTASGGGDSPERRYAGV
jgi:hypothetical protein